MILVKTLSLILRKICCGDKDQSDQIWRKSGIRSRCCLSMKPNSLIVYCLYHTHLSMVLPHGCCLLHGEQLVHCYEHFFLHVTSATIAGEVRSSSGHKSIQDSSKSSSVNLESCHPFHQFCISTIVLHKSHESIKKNCLSSFHKMGSQCSLEILYASSVWFS